jgi:N6-L-threonylcarbamoyladenine synthase
MLGLGYPGGPVIEHLARTKDPKLISFPRTMLAKNSFDFSFSGIKSSVARYIHDNQVTTEDQKAQVAASFQAAVIDVLCKKLINAAQAKKCSRIGISGGVSANQTFVNRLVKRAKIRNIDIFTPPAELCGDNGAMIAARGAVMIQQGVLCDLEHDVFSRTS